MKTVNVSELIGAALDWAVGRAIGVPVGIFGNTLIYRKDRPDTIDGPAPFRPSTDWSQGGPLMDRFIDSMRWIATQYHAWADDDETNEQGGGEGPTYLIAACRAIVAAKLGDTVEVPEELL